MDMNRKIIFLFIGIALIATIFSGCGSDKETAQNKGYVTITDDANRTVSLTKKPERIVALSTSFLEPLHDVDAKVIGCPSSKMGVPEYYKDLAKVGAVYEINIEKVVGLKPDLVIAMKGMNDKFVSTLESNNIPVIVLDMKSYEQVKRCLDIFAKITGEQDKAAAVIKKMDDQIAEVKAKLPQKSMKVAILHSTAQDVTVQLDGSIAGSVAKMLGFTNVAADVSTPDGNTESAPYSLEMLVKKNPDVIFITSMGDMKTIKAAMEKNVENNDAWKSLNAVKNKHVYYLPQHLFLLNPGMHYPQAAQIMAQKIYPDLFTVNK